MDRVSCGAAETVRQQLLFLLKIVLGNLLFPTYNERV